MYEQNSVEFKGVLVDRQYTTEQRYAQLVFETAEGIRLSLSRNINMVRSLRLGSTYKVKGPEHTVGQKRYIHEPTTTLVPVNKFSSISKRYKILIPAALGSIIVLSGVGALTYAAHNTNTNSLSVVHQEKTALKSAPTTNTSTPTSPQPTSDTVSSTSPQQQTTAAPVRVIKKSVPTPPATVTTNPVVNDVVPVPAADEAANPIVPQDNPTPDPIPPVGEPAPSDPQVPAGP